MPLAHLLFSCDLFIFFLFLLLLTTLFCLQYLLRSKSEDVLFGLGCKVSFGSKETFFSLSLNTEQSKSDLLGIYSFSWSNLHISYKELVWVYDLCILIFKNNLKSFCYVTAICFVCNFLLYTNLFEHFFYFFFLFRY